MKTQFKQTQKMPKSGSFFNYLMSNNSSIPVAGEYATIMHYTDRDVVLVHSVSDCGKKVVVEILNTIADKTKECFQGHQNWIHERTGQFYSIEWRNNAWKKVSHVVEFTEEFLNSVPEEYNNAKFGFVNVVKYLQEQLPATYALVYEDHFLPIAVVEGVTKLKKEFSRINILFGADKYYYDWSF